MGAHETEWGVYRGDNFLFIGTTRECAKRLGVKKESVYFMRSKAYQKRIAYENRIILVDLGKAGGFS